MKPIQGYEGIYAITTDGIVWSLKGSRQSRFQPQALTNRIVSCGYHGVTLCKNRRYKQSLVHRLVAETYLPNPENKKTVNHKNGIKNDNRVENLEWNTQQEQIWHAYANNLSKRLYGEKARNVRLSNQDVLRIKELTANGDNRSEIAKQFGISRNWLYQIINGRARIHG